MAFRFTFQKNDSKSCMVGNAKIYGFRDVQNSGAPQPAKTARSRRVRFATQRLRLTLSKSCCRRRPIAGRSAGHRASFNQSADGRLLNRVDSARQRLEYSSSILRPEPALCV